MGNGGLARMGGRMGGSIDGVGWSGGAERVSARFLEGRDGRSATLTRGSAMDEHNSRQGQGHDSNPAAGSRRTVSKGYSSRSQGTGSPAGSNTSKGQEPVQGDSAGAADAESPVPLREVKPIDGRSIGTTPAEPRTSDSKSLDHAAIARPEDHKAEVKPLRPHSRGSEYHGERRPMDPIIPIPGGPSLKNTEGAVKWFDPRKGFGFIVGPEGQDIFVHYTIIEGDGFRVLKDGSAVVYDAVKTEKGWKATRVMRVEGAEPGEITTTPRRGYTRTPRR